MGSVASECLQEGEQRIGRPVAAGLAIHGDGPGERLFLDREIGVHVDLGRLELLIPELALDQRERHPFVQQLDRVHMPKLMLRGPPPNPSLNREVA